MITLTDVKSFKFIGPSTLKVKKFDTMEIADDKTYAIGVLEHDLRLSKKLVEEKSNKIKLLEGKIARLEARIAERDTQLARVRT